MKDKTEKTNKELNDESISRTEEIMALLSQALELIDQDDAMDARVQEYVSNAISAVEEDLRYYKEHGLEDLNKLDDEEQGRSAESEGGDENYIEPTGMYNTPAAMAEIFKNNREVSDERCKEMRRKSIEKMKNGWGETDVMKKKKKEEEQKKK